MQKQRVLQIGVAASLVVGSLGLFTCLKGYQKNSVSKIPMSSVSGVPSENQNTTSSASLMAPSSPASLNGGDLKNSVSVQTKVTEELQDLKRNEKQKNLNNEEECEVVKQDDFMGGALADVEDDSGTAWVASEQADSDKGEKSDEAAKEAAAFAKQAKAFRTIARELAQNGAGASGDLKSKAEIKKEKKKCGVKN